MSLLTNEQYKDFLLYGAIMDDGFSFDGHLNSDDFSDLKHGRKDISEKEILEKLDRLMNDYTNKVKEEIKDEKKVGILLSGGIDSANILSYLTGWKDKMVFAYTWGGWGKNTTDIIYSKFTAGRFKENMAVHKAMFTDCNYEKEKEFYIEEIKKFKVPLDYSSVIPYIFLKKEILKDGIKIVFNGQNADTLFMAYPAPVKIYRLSLLFGLIGLDNIFNPFWMMRMFKSVGAWKYVFKDKFYKKRIDLFYNPINRLPLSLQQKIIVMEEMFTETRSNQNHQKKLLESDGLKVYNHYYDRNFIRLAITVPDKLREKNGFSKYLLYKFAKMRDIPKEVIEKPKKGMSYGYKDFIDKKLHLPVWGEIRANKRLGAFLDVEKAYRKERDNFFLFDRLRSAHYFMIHVDSVF